METPKAGGKKGSFTAKRKINLPPIQIPEIAPSSPPKLERQDAMTALTNQSEYFSSYCIGIALALILLVVGLILTQFVL